MIETRTRGMHRDSSLTPKKVRRRRAPDEVVVEQLRADAVVASRELAALGCGGPEADLMSGCRLAAFRGDEMIGIARVETWVDAALIAPVVVLPSMRRQGVGTSLMRAARIAANTRGALTLFALSPRGTEGFFSRLGFTTASISGPDAALGHFRYAALLSASPGDYLLMTRDISRDGVIVR